MIAASGETGQFAMIFCPDSQPHAVLDLAASPTTRYPDSPMGFPARHRRIGFSSLLLAALSILSTSALSRAAGPASERAEKMRAMMRGLPDGAVPLYVLGDLNEDGKVDRSDLAILTDLVASLKKDAPAPPGVSCIAAADVNRDGDVDSADVNMLKDWLTRVPELSVPALYWSHQLPCSYSRLMIATMTQSHPGEAVPVILIGDGLDTANTKLAIHSGPATVMHGRNDKSFEVKVDSKAKSSDYVVLDLTTPGPREYFYQLPVIEPSHTGEPPMPAGVSR